MILQLNQTMKNDCNQKQIAAQEPLNQYTPQIL